MEERYELVRLLGQGAAGDVYLARDRVLGGRAVALKCLSREVDETLQRALEREFSTTASLSVPGVASVFDFGVMAGESGGGGRTFFTRAYIEGKPLDVAAATESPLGRVRLLTKVARVIAPLHRVGVVHGDIKPGNAIIDRQGDAHVIDFGLARVMGRDRKDEHAGGTLPFMAPELLRGEPPSVQSDVFALGVTLWLLLTGDYPFGRRGWVDGECSPPEIPSHEPVTRAALEVALRALARDPRDRLPTVAEVIAALEEAVPELRGEQARRVFVPPRPRGQLELLGRLQAALASGASQAEAARVVLVTAPTGGGKSLLLRELKWRLQIRGALVLEMSAGGGDATTPLLSLARQLEIVRASGPGTRLARAIATLERARIEEGELSDALAEGFGAVRAKQALVLMFDDLDKAEAICGAVLRSAVFAQAAASVCVVASAADAQAPAVRKLAPALTLKVPPLASSELRELATEVLGAVDASVLGALEEHCQGLPAALMDALAALAELAAPTVADVRKLPPMGAGLELAHARLARAPAGARELLGLLAVLGKVQDAAQLCQVLAALGAEHGPSEELVADCESAGLVARRPDGIGLKDLALEKALLQGLGRGGVRALAARLFAVQADGALPLFQRARLAVLAGDVARMRELVPKAAVQLREISSHAAAAELYEGLLESQPEERDPETLLALARCLLALGELERAAELSAEVLAQPGLASGLSAEAAMVSAQALTLLSRFDQAVSALALVPNDADPDVCARVQRELARVHMRRVDYVGAREAADAGLRFAKDEVLRSELLCSRGMAASYAAEHEAARASLEEAVALARHAGAPREEANALASLAIEHFRTGDRLTARDLFAQCLEIARGLGDVGSMANFSLNLGVLLFCLSEPAAAAEHYENAAQLATRAGRLSTHAQARNNLALLHIYLGLYERAKAEVQSVLELARSAQQKYVEAQAIVLLGDLSARNGDVDQALIHYGDAIARYTALGQSREIAEHHLDAAEVLLDRGGPADSSAAAARLAAAREQIEREASSDLRLRLALLLARTRLASGEAEGAIAALDDVIERARKQRNRDVEWSGLLAASQAHELLGSELTSRRFSRLAVEVLEEIALRVPREHREAFWHDPRRRAARERALVAEESIHRGPASAPSSGDLAALMNDARTALLLDVIKRLASEQDLDRLLQRITESAVDLSGAERGYVLLVDKHGQLEKRTMETAKFEAPDPHAAFSRSIAEAVLIDGAPIVTVDASRDGRLREYVSVHKLMLRSVACLPIRGRSGTVGVLYLEHRRSHGRFSEASVALLHAFADQAAIALENARLIAENARRQEELEGANRALEQAKQDLEELLSARTEALLDAQRELNDARRSARSKAMRHGMIGRSAPMLRVFDTIDRVQGAKVPVIVWGESGTGKELVARAIHEAGVRAKGPFVAINCGSVPESLLESELFGHVEGAFSGAERERRGMIARANGGTLFLDEVGDMPPRMQVDLLRVLQEGTVCRVGGEREEKIDVRFIAASQRNLNDLVQQGKFREDLYYRLNVVELMLPPLRERREDMPLLCQHFLALFAERDGLPEKRLTRAAMERLLSYHWPGNVRQLEHVLLQAFVLVPGTQIDEPDVALDQSTTLPPPPEAEQARPAESLGDFRESERRKILAALEAHGWNRARAAKALGMPRRTFYRRLQDHSIL